MTNSTKNKPVSKFRDGNLGVSIWKNESKNGPYYTVKFTRSYKDDKGEYQDTDSFCGNDLLQVGHLATKAYDKINRFRQADQAQ